MRVQERRFHTGDRFKRLKKELRYHKKRRWKINYVPYMAIYH